MGRYDAIVIGAGIVGAACAHEFARANLRVAIVEENDPGGGATKAGMGHLLIMGDSEAEFVLTRYSLELWRSLAGSFPAECGYWECGTIWVAADEEELSLARRKCEYYASNGVAAEMLDVRQIADAEPNLRPDLAGALLVQRDAAIDPPSAVRFLLDSALQKGAHLITGKRAVSLKDTAVHLSDCTSLSAGSFINATGTPASVLTPGLPIRPRKGHMLVADAGPNFARHQVVELGYLKSVRRTESDSVAFNVRQKTTNELLIGSSRQYGVEQDHIEPAILDRMLTRAIEYMPGLASARQIRSWAGFRAGTPDGLPLIGRCSGFERVYAATGHEGLGVTASLATARLLCDEILNQASALDSTPYSPARFDNEEMKQR